MRFQRRLNEFYAVCVFIIMIHLLSRLKDCESKPEDLTQPWDRHIQRMLVSFTVSFFVGNPVNFQL